MKWIISVSTFSGAAGVPSKKLGCLRLQNEAGPTRVSMVLTLE